jgi:predicted ribosome quality control (RQC) complex YloA/Tae2 family protein
VDFTTLAACVAELQRNWLPAKVEQAVQVETSMLALRLRTLRGNAWLYLSWHPNTAHVGLSERGPERGAVSEAFQFGEQVNSLTRGLVLSDVCQPHPWERVVQLSLAPRPAEPPVISLMCEVQGRYSNVVVTDGDKKVLTAGHQVGITLGGFRVATLRPSTACVASSASSMPPFGARRLAARCPACEQFK